LTTVWIILNKLKTPGINRGGFGRSGLGGDDCLFVDHLELGVDDLRAAVGRTGHRVGSIFFFFFLDLLVDLPADHQCDENAQGGDTKPTQ